MLIVVGIHLKLLVLESLSGSQHRPKKWGDSLEQSTRLKATVPIIPTSHSSIESKIQKRVPTNASTRN
jgi:hypothetical protein